MQLNNYFLLLLIGTDIMTAIDGNDYKNDRAAAPGKYMPAFSLTRPRVFLARWLTILLCTCWLLTAIYARAACTEDGTCVSAGLRLAVLAPILATKVDIVV